MKLNIIDLRKYCSGERRSRIKAGLGISETRMRHIMSGVFIPKKKETIRRYAAAFKISQKKLIHILKTAKWTSKLWHLKIKQRDEKRKQMISQKLTARQERKNKQEIIKEHYEKFMQKAKSIKVEVSLEGIGQDYAGDIIPPVKINLASII